MAYVVMVKEKLIYIYPKYLDIHAWAGSLDQDQIAPEP